MANKFNLTKVSLVLSTSLFLFSCSILDHDHHNHAVNTNVASVADHNHDHDHDHKYDSEAKKEQVDGYSYAYTANYKLVKGSYFLEIGHTHEHELKFSFVKLYQDNVPTTVRGNQLFALKAQELSTHATVKANSNSLYELKLSHNKSWVRIDVTEDGTYTLFTDAAPSKVVPFLLSDAQEKEITPIFKNVVSNRKAEIYNGNFENSWVKDRYLEDYVGQWRSVYPLLVSNKLDVVYKKREETTGKPFAEQKAYYEVGYKTDVEAMEITGNSMTFIKNGVPQKATYKYVGYEILNYAKGNRGVRYLFTQTSNNPEAPKYVQFSDHNIEPVKTNHFHIFTGNTSHQELFSEMEKWPTYYPAKYSDAEIVEEIMAH